MHRDRRRVHSLYLLVDIFFIFVSFYLPYSLRYNFILIPANPEIVKDYSLVFVLWGITLIFILNNYSLYSTNRSLGVLTETWRVLKAVSLSSIFAILVIFTFKLTAVSRLTLGLGGVFLVFALSFWRAIKRLLVRYLILQGSFNLNVLIVGAGKSGQALIREIHAHPYLGLQIVGILDDNKTGSVLGLNILGKIKEIEKIARKKFVDEIYVTIPSERKIVSEIIAHGKKIGKTIRIAADNFDFPFSKVKLNYIGFVPLVTYYEKGLYTGERFIKRSLDVLIAGSGLILLSPLFFCIAVLIKLDSPGPVFYIAKRSGKKGRIFDFYKFRSMVQDADKHQEKLRGQSEAGGPIFKIRNDPRITIVGRFLRKYSLDEFPQLINVIKGDMSLVGPRPFPVDESQKLEHNHMVRLDIRPGITGLAQVRGRSDLSFYHWVRLDSWYINNWSLGLDLRILWWTIPAVFKAKGAY